MKAVAVIFLFICASEAKHNWAGVPEADLTQLDSLLEDTKSVANPSIVGTKSVFGNLVKRAGVKPAGGPKDAMKDLVDAIHLIMPALKKLKDARDKQSHEFGKEFIEVLKSESDDNKVKALFGKHTRTLHEKCNAVKLKFAQAAQESELFGKIKSDNVDFVDVTDNIINEAEEEGGDVFDAFVHAAEKHGLKDHPGVKLIIAIGSLVADAGCDQKLDGYYQSIGKLMKEHNANKANEDEGGYYASKGVSREDCTEWKVMFYCIAMPRYIRQSSMSKLEKRGLTLLFDKGCLYGEGHTVKFTLEVIKDAVALGKKVEYLKYMGHLQMQAMLKTIIPLYHQGKVEEADAKLADYMLGLMRRGMLTSFLLPKYLIKHSHGKGSGEGSEHGEGSKHGEGSGSDELL